MMKDILGKEIIQMLGVTLNNALEGDAVCGPANPRKVEVKIIPFKHIFAWII